jgi:hypothetical protein
MRDIVAIEDELREVKSVEYGTLLRVTGSHLFDFEVFRKLPD